MLRSSALCPTRLQARLHSINSSLRICMTMTSSVSAWKPKFVPIEETTRSGDPSQETAMIRIVSYNILAQAYVKSALFPHSPSACLRWKARSQAILAHLLSFNADFLCLQELDEFESFYQRQLDNQGYSSVYIKRSGKKRDGCGIFFRRGRLYLLFLHTCKTFQQEIGSRGVQRSKCAVNDEIRDFFCMARILEAPVQREFPGRVELVSNEVIDYNDLVPPDDKIISLDCTASSDEGDLLSSDNVLPGKETAAKSITEDRGDPNDPRVRLKRDCVGIMAAFRVIDASHNLIVVTNTHLYWDPEWADVKLAQAKYLVSCVLEFQSMLANKFQFKPPVVICGDFNSTPGDQVYNYLTSGEVMNETLASDQSREFCSAAGLTSKAVSEISLHEKLHTDNSCQDTPMDEMAAKCPLPLHSLYASVKGEPAFTNCTPEFTGTLDYIFFSPLDHLKPVSLLELPSPGSSDVLGGLPNHIHPSDHLPIGTDFLLL